MQECVGVLVGGKPPMHDGGKQGFAFGGCVDQLKLITEPLQQ